MIILDASFLVKLVLEEKNSTVAEKLFRKWIRDNEDIVTIDITLSESFNALWKHYYLVKDIDLETLKEASGDLLNLWEKLIVIDTSRIVNEALDIAVEQGITIYDSLYIALAQYYRGGIASFDRIQRDKAIKLGLKVYPY